MPRLTIVLFSLFMRGRIVAYDGLVKLSLKRINNWEGLQICATDEESVCKMDYCPAWRINFPKYLNPVSVRGNIYLQKRT